MAHLSIGTPNTKSVFFNSGILTVNGKQLGEIQEISITISKTEKNYYTLNSKVKRAVRTSNIDQSVSCKLTGALYRELLKTWFSSSSTITNGLKYTPKDGMEDSMTVVITAYEDDDPTKWIQYELVGAVLLTHNVTYSQQEFQSIDVEFACEYINVYMANSLSTN